MYWGSNYVLCYDCTETGSCDEGIDMNFSVDAFRDCRDFGEASDYRPKISDKEVHDAVDSKQVHNVGAPCSLNSLENVFNPKLRLNSIKK